jgi:hypothetical protein
MTWANELGCQLPDGPTSDRVARQVATDFKVGRTRAGVDPVNDLTIEQAAVLSATGRGDQVPDSWTARLIASQLPDGSWFENLPAGTADYNWHPTMLAVWHLLSLSEPDRADPGFLAGRH